MNHRGTLTRGARASHGSSGQEIRLSIIIPAYNERGTIQKVLAKIVDAKISACEIIVVDDGSTDGTAELLQSDLPANTKLIVFPQNQGKTAAVRAGLMQAAGKWVIIQDADLEYDPADILGLLRIADESAVVFGRRPGCWHMPERWLFACGVLLVDLLIVAMYGRWLRDHATCYKLLPRCLLLQLDLTSKGFEGCIEITSKLMRSGIPIRQGLISYAPRPASEGKKLTLSYGWVAFAAVLKFRKWRPSADLQNWEKDFTASVEKYHQTQTAGVESVH